jgi:hypothetical protein
MADNREDVKKRELMGLIDKVSEKSEKIVVKGHVLVQEGQLQKSFAGIAKRIVEKIPDDTYITSESWDNQISMWGSNATRLNAMDKMVDMSMATVTTASLAWSTSGFQANMFVRKMSADNEAVVKRERDKLNELLMSSSWNEKVEIEFKRLGIEKDSKHGKSALSLLRSAYEALVKPSGINPDENAVLIPARESIHRCLADLLCRRPRAEQARKPGDKVKSICNQLAFGHVTGMNIEQLAQRAEKLIDSLSSAKQKNIPSEEIIEKFNQVKAFLFEFTASIDDKKMR